MSVFKKREDDFDYLLQRTCLTCHTTFQGKYCGRCGEKVIEPHEKSIKEFIEGLINAFTFLDGKFIRSFKLMLKNPGQFSKFFSEGIRQPYMKLVSFFFVANFIFFLFPFITSNTFSTPLQYQPKVNLYGATAQKMIDNKMLRDNISFEALEKKYKNQSDSMAKILIVTMVFLFAIPLTIVNYSGRLFFADHLYLSFEFNAYFVYVNMILVSFALSILFLIAHFIPMNLSIINDRFFTVLHSVLSGYFLIRAQRTFYQQKWWVAIVKTILLLILLIVCMQVYKGILFFLTMWTI